MKNKLISIIDCYVYNDNVKNLLIEKINFLKSIGRDILLISNSHIDKEIVEEVNFFLYDRNNPLFELDYSKYDAVDFYEYYDHFEVHDIVSNRQRHGLSVLINLFRSIKIAKSMGYDFFERHEVDDIMGEESKNNLKNLPLDNFYFINYRELDESDISFHYFMFNIDFFLKNVKEVNSEIDYNLNINDFEIKNKFYNVEQYLYNFLIKSDSFESNKENSIKKTFTDTKWNTSSTPQNFKNNKSNVIFNLYQVVNDKSRNVIYFKNNSNQNKNIRFKTNNMDKSFILNEQHWYYQPINNTYSVDVWIDDTYHNIVSDGESYIKFN